VREGTASGLGGGGPEQGVGGRGDGGGAKGGAGEEGITRTRSIAISIGIIKDLEGGRMPHKRLPGDLGQEIIDLREGEAMVIELVTSRVKSVEVDGDKGEVLPRDAITKAKETLQRTNMTWREAKKLGCKGGLDRADSNVLDRIVSLATKMAFG